MSPPTAIITGASSGIGLAAARLLAERGWRVFGATRSGAYPTPLDGVTPVPLDVTDAESIAAALRRVDAETAGEGLAALVNNAGVATPAPLETASLADVRCEIETNALGALAVTQAFLPLLKRTGGRVLFLGSPLGARSRELCGGYAASKAALRSIADTLRLELAGAGVGVGYVEADKIATPLWSKASTALRRLDAAGAHAPMVESARRLIEAAERGDGFAAPEVVAGAIHRALTADAFPATVHVP